MGKTKRKPETIYVDHEKFELLDQLAKTTRIPRSVLWREALDDVLTKHGMLKVRRRIP
jgi:predicted transcriptional regulator